MKPGPRRWLSWLAVPRAWVLLLALALSGLVAGLYAAAPVAPRALVLLVPDAAALRQPVAQAWLDAAHEEGLPLLAMTDDEFMRYSANVQDVPGVILPDTVHRRASDLLVNLLQSYVANGGKLLLSYDAALYNTHSDTYAAGESRLSRLVGVRYAMYGDLRDMTIAQGPVFGTHETEEQLQIQPGKLDFKFSSHAELGELVTYGYAVLSHSYFRTGTSYGARALMSSAQGDLVIGKHRAGKGEVLFANLPLGYLKTRTDGFMLHRLLSHFGVRMVGLPRLAPVPEGRGGLVLNLHIDSNAAQQPLLQLEQWGWFKTGPFSMHVTAGPHTYEVGDHMGLDITRNQVMRDFLRRQAALGHEMGNHGGWNHDVFGEDANEENREEFEPWLDLNNRSMAAALGQPMRVYSAPQGNQPVWATKWLERNGFKAYYFTGDLGMGPTRSYYEGKRPERILWAFPVSNLLKIATFEELDNPKAPLTADDIGNFLTRLSNYVAEHRVARLFYFHPPAAPRYTAVMEGLMAQAKRLGDTGRFRWYTMEALADFMTRREATKWSFTEGATGRTLRASNPAGLQQLAWIFPADGVTEIKVRQGQAEVRRQGNEWVVTASGGKDLVLSVR